MVKEYQNHEVSSIQVVLFICVYAVDFVTSIFFF